MSDFMGTAIGDLVLKKEISLEKLKGKTLGFDAYNIIYQFLTTIRGLDGELLTNSKGQVTSHIIGLFYRLTKILENEIDVVFVFDGKPLELKKETLEKRKDIKIEAEEKARIALEKGNIEETIKQKKRTSRITDEMIIDAKKILDGFGIPYLTAKADGEAQLSVMNEKNIIDGVVSQDYDTLLFGAKDLYRNLTMSGKRKVPGKDYYVQIKPEHINLKETLEKLEISREKLIWIGILIGTDFNEKIPKVGPKTALKLVKEHNSLNEIFAKLNYKPDFDVEKIENIFLNPPYNENFSIEKKPIDFEKLKHLLIDEFEFNEERVENNLKKLKKITEENKKQSKLTKWF